MNDRLKAEKKLNRLVLDTKTNLDGLDKLVCPSELSMSPTGEYDNERRDVTGAI